MRRMASALSVFFTSGSLFASHLPSVTLLLAVVLLANAARLSAQDIPPLDFGNFGGSNAGSVTVTSRFVTDPNGDRGALQVMVEIPTDHHIYSITQKPGGPSASEVVVAPGTGFEIIGPFQADKPPHVEFTDYYDVPVESHEGSVTWSAPIQIVEGTDVNQLTISGTVEGQLCTDSNCIPLSNVTFDAEFGGVFEDLFPEGAAADLPSAAGTSAVTTVDWPKLFWNVGYGILGGMILNLMPCVLPVIGLKIMSFIEQSQGSRSRAFMLNVIYSLGILSVFLILASLAAGANLGWGEQFTHMPFKITLIAVVFAMALSFLGVWEIPIPGFVGSGKSAELASQEGAAGAFFKGVFATVLATPCSGPFLGPIFAYTVTQPPFVTYIILLSVGLGMALPYLVIGLFPELARWIPKPGAWMETFKELMGFVLLATVVFLFTTLGNADYFVPTLSLLFGLWFACWWVGKTPITAALDKKLIRWASGLIFVGVTGYLSMNFLVPREGHIEWQPYSKTSLAAAQNAGKTVLVDFTAQWCPTCKFNLATAIDTRDVGNLVEELGVVPLIADWTDRSSEIKNALAELNSISIPLLAIYPASDPANPIVLRDVVTKRQVLEALEQAGPSTDVEQISSSSSTSQATKR